MKYKLKTPIVITEIETSEVPPSFTLLYDRLDGVRKSYAINSITFMDKDIIKCITKDGWRSFRTSRVVSMLPKN